MNKRSRRFQLNHLTEYTDRAILEEIRRVANLTGSEPLTIREFQEHARVGISTIRRHFDTWRKALKTAGLEHLYNDSKSITNKMKVQHGKGMSDNEIVTVIRAVASELETDTLTIEEFNQHAPISASTACRHFGGWGKALKKAGLVPKKLQQRYTDEECFENLLEVWTYYGRPPKYHEMPLPPSMISVRAYIDRWGSWRKSLKAFVDYVNKEEVLEQQEKSKYAPIDPAENQESKLFDKSLPDANRREIKIGLRYKILKRDCFRCVKCGRSPATTYGLELHVDHIKPWSKGGLTVPENLRSLCRDCNIGKGSKEES